VSELAPVASDQVALWERLARDPQVDVAKLERLIAMQKDILAQQAKIEFNAAFATMQGELPTIDEHGQAVIPGKYSYTHARQEDIIEIVRPILQKHGFSLRFRHQYPNGKIKTIGILTHRAGHYEEDEFECDADKSGGKNDIQAVGSARTYGERYTTRALLNIVSRDPKDAVRDTDGHRNATSEQPAAPEGLETWRDEMWAVADEGWTRMNQAWTGSKPAFTNYALKHLSQWVEQLKQRARAADRQKVAS
jgi:ERF superfamily